MFYSCFFSSLAVILFHYGERLEWGQWFLIRFYFPILTNFYDKQN